jgi:hypothetical protein
VLASKTTKDIASSTISLHIIYRVFAFVPFNHSLLACNFFHAPIHPLTLRQTPGALCDTPFFAPSSRCSSFCTFGVRRARELCSLSRARWAALLQSPPIVLLMATCTLLALFLDDVRSLAAVQPVSADAGFQAVIFACFIIFVAEFLLQTWAIREYRLSLFQLLDFISCLSLLPEIPWLWYVFCFHRILLDLFILHSLHHVVFSFCRHDLLSLPELDVPSIALFVDVFPSGAQVWHRARHSRHFIGRLERSPHRRARGTHLACRFARRSHSASRSLHSTRCVVPVNVLPNHARPHVGALPIATCQDFWLFVSLLYDPCTLPPYAIF